jgi:Iron-containing redox enzyme
MTMFGLHRRLRGAAVGHLAALEMTSSLPNRRYGNGLRRLGFGAEVTRFFDEHIEADAVHEQIAAHDLARGLAVREPVLVDDILFGAAAALATDGLVARHLLAAWEAGQSSMRC